MIFAADISSAVSKEECEELARLAEGLDVLEMGSYLGRSTIALASTARRVWAVDHWLGDAHVGRGEFYPGFMDNIVRYRVSNRIEVCCGSFEDIVPNLGRKFPFVFLDGQHDKASVARDAQLALDALEPGGAVAFHDYGSIFPVHEVVDELEGELTVVRTLAVLRGAK